MIFTLRSNSNQANLLHKGNDCAPTLLVEAVLQNVVWLMATRAIISENLFHASIISRVFRQCGKYLVPRQLFREVLHRLHHKSLMGFSAQIRSAMCGLI